MFGNRSKSCSDSHDRSKFIDLVCSSDHQLPFNSNFESQMNANWAVNVGPSKANRLFRMASQVTKHDRAHSQAREISASKTYLNCLGLGHSIVVCGQHIRCKACFNYGHKVCWCFTKSKPRIVWRPKAHANSAKEGNQFIIII